MNKTIGKYPTSSRIPYSHLYEDTYNEDTYNEEKVLVRQLNAKVPSPEIVEKIKKIKHKNVLALIDVVENQYLVYEFCSGESLVQYVKKHDKNLNEEKVKVLLSQLVEVYNKFYINGFLHLHFYPRDIFITEQSIMKVGNIGLDMSENSYSGIWSIGAIMYYMLHGRFPYRDIEQLPLYDELRYTVKADLSPCCLHLLSSCLQSDENERLNLKRMDEYCFFRGSPCKHKKYTNYTGNVSKFSILGRYDYLIDNRVFEKKESSNKETPKDSEIKGESLVKKGGKNMVKDNTQEKKEFECNCIENKPVLLACGHFLCLRCAAEIKESIALHRIEERDAKCPICYSTYKLSKPLYNQ